MEALGYIAVGIIIGFAIKWGHDQYQYSGWNVDYTHVVVIEVQTPEGVTHHQLVQAGYGPEMTRREWEDIAKRFTEEHGNKWVLMSAITLEND